MKSEWSENDEVQSPSLGMPELRIRLEKNDAGWADLLITLDGVTGTIWLSQVSDPFCNIADWGRRVESGDLPVQMEIDEEGPLVTLSALAADDSQRVLFRVDRRIPTERDLDEVLVEGIVDRAALARTLQSELRRYFTTDFDPWQWDMHSYDVFDGGPAPTHVRMLNHGWIKPQDGVLTLSSRGRFLCHRVVSGGQTGADRAALDFAIAHRLFHDGWAPKGMMAEDGPISPKYQLRELPEGGYRQRTKRNVQSSDGTLIVNLCAQEGGSLATQVFARQMGRPCFVAPLDIGDFQETSLWVAAWLQAHDIAVLNVAGPRESKRPGVYAMTYRFLEAVDAICRRHPEEGLQMSRKG